MAQYISTGPPPPNSTPCRESDPLSPRGSLPIEPSMGPLRRSKTCLMFRGSARPSWRAFVTWWCHEMAPPTADGVAISRRLLSPGRGGRSWAQYELVLSDGDDGCRERAGAY